MSSELMGHTFEEFQNWTPAHAAPFVISCAQDTCLLNLCHFLKIPSCVQRSEVLCFPGSVFNIVLSFISVAFCLSVLDEGPGALFDTLHVTDSI